MVLPGVPDMVIAMAGGRLAFMEIKTPKGRLSQEQRAFRQWCEQNDVPYAVCCSSDQIIAFYQSLGVLKDGVKFASLPRPDVSIAA